jgi:hypothetical protein
VVLVVAAGPEGQAGDHGHDLGRIDGPGDVRLEAGQERAFPVVGSGEGGEGGGRSFPGCRIGPHCAHEIISIRFGDANIAYDHLGEDPPDRN